MSLWINNEALELRPNATEEDLQIIIRAVYRQVLGNAHVLESQRLTSAESMLRNGEITVRGFVRAVAMSDIYKDRFFNNSSPYRFIELNFKHLLGRAPQDQTEISEHVQTYNGSGYEAEIDSYLDSDEYLSIFGENVVPYARSVSQKGVKNVAFNRLFALERGYAANDTGKNAKLISDVAGNRGTKIKTPARGGSGAYSNTGKRFRIVASKANFGSRVTKSNYSVEVGYDQLSNRLQNMQRSGTKIVSVSEV